MSLPFNPVPTLAVWVSPSRTPLERQVLARALPSGGNSEGFISADGEQLIVTNLAAGIDSRFFKVSDDGMEEYTVEGVPATSEFWNDTDPLNRWIFAFANGVVQAIDRSTLKPAGLEFDAGIGNDITNDGRLGVNGTQTGASVYDAQTIERVSPELDMTPWGATPGFGISNAVFDSDGERVILSINSGVSVAFDTSTWEPGAIISPDDVAGGATTARFSRDGSILVTRGVSGTIAVRDPVTFDVIRTIEGGTSAAEGLAPGPYISPDGEYLLTVKESVPRLWHLPSRTVIGTFPHEAGLVASGNDKGDELRMVSLLGDHALLWNLDVDTWPEIACRAGGRNLSVAEWKSSGPRTNRRGRHAHNGQAPKTYGFVRSRRARPRSFSVCGRTSADV